MIAVCLRTAGPSAGCRSPRSTPASRATSGRSRTCGTSCARRARPGGSCARAPDRRHAGAARPARRPRHRHPSIPPGADVSTRAGHRRPVARRRPHGEHGPIVLVHSRATRRSPDPDDRTPSPAPAARAAAHAPAIRPELARRSGTDLRALRDAIARRGPRRRRRRLRRGPRRPQHALRPAAGASIVRPADAIDVSRAVVDGARARPRASPSRAAATAWPATRRPTAAC